MTAPAFLVTPYYDRLTGVDDVQDILDRLSTILTAIGWTESPSGTFTMPADAAGRYMKTALVRFSATRLYQTMTDDYGRSAAQRAMDISGGSDVIDFYYSTNYLYIVNASSGTRYDFLWISLLSQSPEAEDSHNNYHACGEGRSTAGSGSGGVTYASTYNKSVGSYDAYAAKIVYPYCGAVAAGNAWASHTPSGARRWFPVVWYGSTIVGGTHHVYGKSYNVLVTNLSLANYLATYPVPIDEASSANFMVMNINTQNNILIAARIP